MRFNNKYLDILAHGQTKILVFDCEFWHVLGQAGDTGIKFNPDSDFFFIPRELGAILLTRNKDGSWSYNNKIYVTLSKPNRDVAFPVSHFSTVTAPTARILDGLEKKLGKAWGDAFYSRLTESGQEAYREGIKTYDADSNIKNHHKPPSWYKTFMKHYSESMIVVKGPSDIDALKNASKMYGFDYLEPLDVTDIAIWNKQSWKKCGTAKLAGTFDCIKRELDEETAHLADHLPLVEAHDPSTDASMTLLVALYIVSQQP
jgi:hypothetical protein